MKVSTSSYQWTYHLIIYAPLIFDGKLLQPLPFLRTSMLVLCFCLASSSVAQLDERVAATSRPLRPGQISPTWFVAVSVTLGLLSVGVATALDRWAGIITGSFWLHQVAYALYLKRVVLIDVLVQALGFLLRLAAGAAVVAVTHFSPWLYVCVALLALLFGFGKRRQEVLLLDKEVSQPHTGLAHYNVLLLDQLLGLVTASILIAYTLYSFVAETALASHDRMLLTVPFVFYFVARYLYLIHVRKLGGAPDILLLHDKPLLVDSLLWLATVVFLIYGG